MRKFLSGKSSSSSSSSSNVTAVSTAANSNLNRNEPTPEVNTSAALTNTANTESWFPSESDGQFKSNTNNTANSSSIIANMNSNQVSNGELAPNSSTNPQAGQASGLSGPGQQRPYTIPGVLHYLQYEWNRFEQERQQWDIERAELNARIALLQGERKGQENLKKDLVRRIKMLEYCLRQERARYHKFRYGTEPATSVTGIGSGPNGQTNGTIDKDDLFTLNSEGPILLDGADAADGQNGANGAVSWKHGRQLLRQYLQEIGYTDTIIDVRSNRVRSLLGLSAAGQLGLAGDNPLGCDSNNTSNTDQGGSQVPGSQKGGRYNPAGSLAADQQDSMRAAFEILDQTGGTGRNGPTGQGGPGQSRRGPGVGSGGDEDDDGDDDDEEDINELEEGRNAGFVIDSEVEEVIAEFDFLHGSAVNDPPAYQPRMYEGSGGMSRKEIWRSDGSKDMGVDIGELAAVTITNDQCPDLNGQGTESGSTTTDGETRKTWSARYLLKSHFDCVRSLKFHHNEPLLITCSEDETIKLWNLTKTQMPSGKGKNQSNPNAQSTFDLEPVFTYRGHHASVLTLELYGNMIFTGASNGELYMWQIPETIASIDPYEPFNTHLAPKSPSPGGPPHSDSIWSMALISSASSQTMAGSETRPLLVSLSADSTLKLWEIGGSNGSSGFTCVRTLTWPDAVQGVKGTCVVAVGHDAATCIPAAQVQSPPGSDSEHTSSSGIGVATLIAVSFSSGVIWIVDVERAIGSSSGIATDEIATLSPLFSIDSSNSPATDGSSGVANASSSKRVNAIVVHPSAPVLVSAHADRTIRFWDLKSATCTHSMVAHLDEVSCLATDPNGLYLLSGSHDCSIRLWNLDTRTCVQEITSHRKKFDESIFDVTFHPSRPLFATAGADGLAKVFI